MERFRAECLVADGSLLVDGEEAWTEEAIAELYEKFIKNPYLGTEGGGKFDSKWELQLDGVSPTVRRLAAEMMLVHLLFPSSVSPARKKRLVANTLQADDLSEFAATDAVVALQSAIGNPGIGFNTRRDLQIGFLIEFSRVVKAINPGDRGHYLDDPWLTYDLATQVPHENQREMMHILLHLLHPDHFERIASLGHKRQIAKAFAGVLSAPSDPEVQRTVDQELLEIRRVVEDRIPQGNTKDGRVDFYSPPLSAVWSSRDNASADGVTDLDSLLWKKQVIFYGPPGTGKTYSARRLASELISSAALRDWGIAKFLDNPEVLDTALKNNYTKLQLHPGYGYSDFIRGAQLVDNTTRYVPGVLFDVLIAHESQELHASDGSALPSLPSVLVLDEINRTDLSSMLGETFSLFESDKRGEAITLPGVNHGEDPAVLILPEHLYIIGTMNEIDQSVETLDFALRRRFLWTRFPFNRDALIEILGERWKQTESLDKFDFQRAMPQIEKYADAAERLNSKIAEMDDLGDAYEVGHSYFSDVVFFIDQWIQGRSSVMAETPLWAQNGDPRAPLQGIWKRSLEPLLEQYLISIDSRKRVLETLWRAFSST